eukprot:scaffold5649_cov105-Pinguiococcus_pyrenoidosus.AAC.1
MLRLGGIRSFQQQVEGLTWGRSPLSHTLASTNSVAKKRFAQVLCASATLGVCVFGSTPSTAPTT